MFLHEKIYYSISRLKPKGVCIFCSHSLYFTTFLCKILIFKSKFQNTQIETFEKNIENSEKNLKFFNKNIKNSEKKLKILKQKMENLKKSQKFSEKISKMFGKNLKNVRKM